MGAAAAMANLVSSVTVSGQLTQVLIVLAVSSLIYVPLIRWLAPDACRDIGNRVNAIWWQVRRQVSTAI